MNEKENKPDLEFVTTDELIAEFMKRCVGAVIVFIPLADTERVSFQYHGHRLIAQGLLVDGERIMDEKFFEMKNLNPEEMP